MSPSLVRPRGFPRGRHQSASKSVSTTDVSRHEHPSRHFLRRLSAERCGVTRQRSTSRSSPGPRFRFAGEDTGPPRGHPVSDSRALDGALPASGPSTATLVRFRAGRGRALRPCQPGSGSVDGNPLTPLSGRPAGGLPEQPATNRLVSLPPLARQCQRLSRNRGAFHRRRPRERPFRELDGSAAHAGRRGSCRTPSSMFENID